MIRGFAIVIYQNCIETNVVCFGKQAVLLIRDDFFSQSIVPCAFSFFLTYHCAYNCAANTTYHCIFCCIASIALFSPSPSPFLSCSTSSFIAFRS